MFLLDTNVVSETPEGQSRQGRQERRRLGGQRLGRHHVRVGDNGSGTGDRRPPRRTTRPNQGVILRRWLETQVLPAFAERILPVDTAVARRSAVLHIPDPRPIRESLVAATALVHEMPVVTRNVTDFAPRASRSSTPGNPPTVKPD